MMSLLRGDLHQGKLFGLESRFDCLKMVVLGLEVLAWQGEL